MDLSGYNVTFRRDRLFGLWTWTAETPDDGSMSSMFGFKGKGAAEADALRAVERHAETHSLDGDALRRKVRGDNDV